ncbi:MAG: hypothetical protein GY810_08160 [Aureispira sp.]|nr:hypothetical protein [Aureispira sp.]
MYKQILTRITCLIVFCVATTSFLSAQQYKISDQCNDSNYAKQVQDLADNIVDLISQHKETKAAQAELELSTNYIPKYYLNIEDQEFERPSYSGDLTKDLKSFNEAIYSWVSFDLQRADDLLIMLQSKKTLKF